MITEADLKWWLELAPTLTFKNASTYEETAPHNYVVRDRHLESEDFYRACRVIHSFGEIQRFHSRVNAYLVDHDRNLKWWTMGMKTQLHGVINQGQADVFYGKQDLPKTNFRGRPTHHYDGLSTFWDVNDEEPGLLVPQKQIIRDAVRDAFGAYAPSVLDLGAGTGALLDMGITSPKIYTAVEISSGMANHLIVKYPTVKELWMQDMNTLPAMEPAELVTAIGGSASYLDPAMILNLPKLSRRLIILQHFVESPEWAEQSSVNTAREVALGLSRKLTKDHGGRALRSGNLETHIIPSRKA